MLAPVTGVVVLDNHKLETGVSVEVWEGVTGGVGGGVA